MKKYCCLFAIVGIVAFYFTCTQDVAGTNDETSGGIIASLYYKDGTPAANAVIKIFEISDTSKQPAYTALTDNKGAYKIESIKVGTYNVWGAKDTLVAYQGSVLFTKSSSNLKDDTLENGGSITGIVGVQPNHDPRTVTVQILGSEITADNVDIGGRFTIPQLARGSYKLRLTTTLPEYTPTYNIIQKSGNATDTLADTLWLIYTGIPVVTGLTAICDTLNGIIKLKWNKTGYLNFQDYALFKDPADSGNMTDKPFGFTADTFYIDTIFGDMNDINDYKLKYRAAVRNNSQNIGLTYKYISITAASPTKVQTTISARTISKITGDEKDTVSTKDTALIIADFSNPTRAYKQISWAFGHPDSIVGTQNIATSKTEGNDTLVFTKTIEGDYKLYITVEDIAGTKWFDTVLVPIWDLPEPVTFFVDSIFGYTAYLRWTKNKDSDFKDYRLYYIQNPKDTNEIIRDTVITHADDTMCVITSLIPDSTVYSFFVGSIDSIGLESYSNAIIDTTLTLWKKKKDMLQGVYNAGSSVVNGKIYVITGMSTATTVSSAVQVYDPITDLWRFANEIMVEKRRGFLTCGTIGGKIYSCGGFCPPFIDTNILKSNDEYDPTADTWTIKAPMPTGRYGLTSCVLGGKMYAIGGINSSDKESNVIEEYDPTTDTWTQKTPMPTKRSGLTSCALNGKIYAIGGFSYDHSTMTETCYATVEEYDPISNSWTIKPPMGNARKEAACCVFDGKIYVMGGTNFPTLFNTIDVFDPIEGIWTIIKPLMPTPRNGLMLNEINGKIYAVGGQQNQLFAYPTVEEYTISK